MEPKNRRPLVGRSRRGKDPPRESPGDARVAEDTPPSSAAREKTGRSAIPSDDERDVHRRASIPHLPAVFRSAMILSLLEGFSAAEIGRLAGVQPGAIETLLARGRELMQEEFIAYVRRHDGANEVADRAEDPVVPAGPVGEPASCESEEQ